jgi:N-ethylmaleimide reductase
MWHVGRISHESLQPGGGKPVAPSAIRARSKTYLINADGTGSFAETTEPRALEPAEIAGIVEDYRKAARAAVDACFDGVEIHAANGYLIDQFLRSDSNKRSDAYGGSIENRARFLFEVLDAVTKEVGAGRVGIRISPATPANDACDPEPQPLFTYVVENLARYAALRSAYTVGDITRVVRGRPESMNETRTLPLD